MGEWRYDVFISYRREGGSELAEVVRTHLAKRGYKAYLDVRDMPAGPFDESLMRQIETTSDFVVLLTKGCLDRCENDGDWFRAEIAHALATKRTIVPLRIEDFEYPPENTLPDDIAQLPKQHSIRYVRDHCDAAINEVCRLLSSRQRVKRHRIFRTLTLAGGLLAVVVVWWIFMLLQGAKPTGTPPPPPTVPTLAEKESTVPAAKPLPANVAHLPAADVLEIAYTGAPPTANAQAQKPNLQTAILARRQGEDAFTALKDGDSLASQQDDYFMAFRPLSPGCLYVFQVDSFGKKTWLFPKNKTSEYSSGSNPVEPQAILQVPSAESERVLYLDNNIGTEHVYAVFSATRWLALEETLARPGGPVAPSPPAETDPSVLAAVVRTPNGLLNRGVGGSRVEGALSEATASLMIERFDQGQNYAIEVSAKPVRASGSFLVIERWFRHVKPD